MRKVISLIEQVLKIRNMDTEKKIQLKKLRDLEDDIISGKEKVCEI